MKTQHGPESTRGVVQVQAQFYFISFDRSTTLQKLKQYNFKFTFSVVIRYDQNKFIKLQF